MLNFKKDWKMQTLLNHLALNKILLLLSAWILFAQTTVAQEAQQPTIMIIPSDNLLNRLGCIDKSVVNQGEQIYNRNYQKAFIEDGSLKFIISGIQGKFAERGFPLVDLEQKLKQIQDEQALDIADNIETDLRSMLLNTARPDIILDLNYELKKGGMAKLLTFDITAKDAYTLEAIGNAQHPGIETIETNIETLMAEQVALQINNLQARMQAHFNDIKANGRKITLRITVEAGSSFTMEDLCPGVGDEYSYVISDWLKRNTVKSSFTPSPNKSDYDLRFTNVRIPLFDKEGFPMSATDFVRQLRTHLSRTCNVGGRDRTIGLGGGVLMLNSN
jgi:hypothetical protein